MIPSSVDRIHLLLFVCCWARMAAADDASGPRLGLLEAGGPACVWTDEGGRELSTPAPLVRWRSGPAPHSNATGHQSWTSNLGPEELTCNISSVHAGAFGEHRFSIELRNTGSREIQGTLLPGLCGWLDGPASQEPGADHFLILAPDVYVGGIGRLPAWIPSEFARDACVVVPAGEGHYLCAVLLAGPGAKPVLSLKPGATARFTLHLHAGKGGRHDALAEVYRRRGGYRVKPADYDFSQYDDPQLAWVKDLLVGWLNFAWDQEVLNPRTGEYRLIESLKQGQRRFGGYDLYVFWPFWPRAGFDSRFQFDHYGDMPGGLDGLAAVIRSAGTLGVRTAISSCIWSETDRDKTAAGHQKSYESLVDLAVRLGAHGVLMDVMATTPEEIRQLARSRGRDLLPYAEFDPNWTQSQTNLLGRIHNILPMPAFNLKKYLLPHHPQLRVCEPGGEGRVMQKDFVLSFFNGHGVEINTMFAEYLPSTDAEWAILRDAVGILRTNRAAFRSTGWQPLVETLNSRVLANAWPDGEKTIYTLCCTDPAGHRGPLLRVPHRDGHYVDLWRYRAMTAERENNMDVLACDLDPYTPGRAGGGGDYSAGCVAFFPARLGARLEFEMLQVSVVDPQPGEKLEIWPDASRPDTEPLRVNCESQNEVDLYKGFGCQTNRPIIVRLLDSVGQLLDVVVLPETPSRFFRIDKSERTVSVDPQDPPADMVRVAGGSFTYIVQHTVPTWQACYHLRTSYHSGPASEPRTVDLRPFWMDRFPVTNAQFARFVQDSRYRPADPSGFLAHFVDGHPPAGQERHPVVHVSYDDAKAYAAWAGKRLPTEPEWQMAAGAADGRAWPWGNEAPNEQLCTWNAEASTPVGAHPAGRSPFGVEDLVGNVWQWTELMDNGRHLVVFLRGGSWYHPPKGNWWVAGGPRRVDDHHPFPLSGPALNRLATVGFRCVKDE
ncbi:MAG: hypothetical protein AMXMBFR13_16200 [Phycisphaerae bacterium]